MANVYRLSRSIRRLQQGAKPFFAGLGFVVAATTATIMISDGSIGRNLDIPRRASISFTGPRNGTLVALFGIP